MGKAADKWRKNWGDFFSANRSYYERAAECKETKSGLDAMECAVAIMKEIPKERRGAYGGRRKRGE